MSYPPFPPQGNVVLFFSNVQNNILAHQIPIDYGDENDDENGLRLCGQNIPLLSTITITANISLMLMLYIFLILFSQIGTRYFNGWEKIEVCIVKVNILRNFLWEQHFKWLRFVEIQFYVLTALAEQTFFLVWYFRALLSLNLDSQLGQPNGRTFSCTDILWRIRLVDLKNSFSHSLHW